MVLTRRLSAMSAGVLAAGLLGGCSQPSFSFKQDDNVGYIACRDGLASQAVQDRQDQRTLLESAAAYAAAAQTAAIRDTVDPPVDEDQLERVGPEDWGLYTVDIEALVAACEGVGFNADDVEVPDPSS